MKKLLKDFILILLGCVIYALAFILFLEPHLIAPGGVSGLAMVVNYITGFPLGVTIIIFNAPLFVVAYIKMGYKFIAKTILATVLSSIFIDLGMAFLGPFTHDILLASLYGGVLLGLGMSLVFLAGASTGGSDIISKLLKLYKPHIKLGRIILIVDTCIIIISASIFQNIDLALYAAIALYVTTIIIDAIMYGLEKAAICYIISSKYEEIGDAIQKKLDRGITYISGSGGYTKESKQIIMCTVKRNQSVMLSELAYDIDPVAFIIMSEAHHVYGDGFTRYEK